jgi:F-type H+-transporting ATPase subunit a
VLIIRIFVVNLLIRRKKLVDKNIKMVNSEIIHENTIFAEPIMHIGNFSITNSLMTSWVAVAIIILLALAVRRKVAIVPKGIQNFFEFLIESFLDLFDSITGSRKKSAGFFPFVFAFFMFIIVCNLMGLLPGVGTIGHVVAEEGHKVFVPFFRGGTADLNTTLALAIIGVVASHIFSVMSLGFWKYFNKFVNIKAFLEIPGKIRKDPAIILVNPIKFLVGLMEIISELAKVASLSFRLFGNVFAGEVLLASMAAMMAFGLPLPFMFLEVLVGVIQALIFAVLILSYLSMMSVEEEH